MVRRISQDEDCIAIDDEERSGNAIILKSRYVSIRDQLSKARFDPVKAMIDIARNEENPVGVRRQATKDLLDKAFPDLRAIDFNASSVGEEEISALKNSMAALMIENKKSY